MFDKCKRFHGQPMRNKHLTEDGKVVSLARKDLMAEGGKCEVESNGILETVGYLQVGTDY